MMSKSNRDANPNSSSAPPRIAVILAGGASKRMGGADKVLVKLAGMRLIDRVIERLSPQANEIVIAGPNDYGTGLRALPDSSDGPSGPAAGLLSALQWIGAQRPNAKGFVTAPADGPFLPEDLFSRLAGEDGCAVASDQHADHPTFAYWDARALKSVLTSVPVRKGVALHELARRCGARTVVFENADCFFNVNSPEDLKAATEILSREPG